MLLCVDGENFFVLSGKQFVLPFDERAGIFPFQHVKAVGHLVDNLLTKLEVPLDDYISEDDGKTNSPNRRLELERDNAKHRRQFGELKFVCL